MRASSAPFRDTALQYRVFVWATGALQKGPCRHRPSKSPQGARATWVWGPSAVSQ